MRPPILDGSNYDYWKPLMVAFLKSVNSKAWRAVNKGWEHPVNTDKDGNKTLKPEEDWDKDEEALALGNSKALNALFNGIDKNIFRLVHHCELAKDVWDILKTTHEGTSKVKMSRLQLLTTKFENLRMRDDESIKDFYMNLLDIANTSGALGEKMSDEKLVRKILRSLPKRFDMKVTAIEEAHDIRNMKVEELIGSLQTFEMGMNENSEKKNKSIAFVSNSQEESREENLSDSIAMLGKQFNKIIRSMDQKPRPNVKNISSDISRSYDSGRRDKSEEKYNHSKGIQCHGCEGYGHIRAECPTYLKKQKKGLSVSWSDEDSESDFEEESAKHVTALTGVYNSDEDSSEDELSFEELATSYRKLCIRSAEVCQQGEKQKKYIAQLEADNKELNETISELNDEVILLQSKLDQMSKSVKMLNNGTDMLEEILQVGKSSRDMSGIGFVSTKKYVQDSSRTKPEAEMSKPMSKHVTQHHEKGEMKRKFQRWRCHYCGRFGHIKPFCFRLYGYPDQAPSYKPKQIMPIQKQHWKPKSMALIAHTSLRVSAKEDWYFDSGCSRHMTGLKNLLVDIKSHSTSYVTFGDGAKGEIKGVGKLDCSGVPNLEDVLLVKDLNANLISISQLCDQGYQVNFTKDECVVTNEEKEVVMRGVRSKNNCFLWVSQESSHSTICSKEEEAKLWHQKLGHLYLRDWAGSADNRKRISGGCSFVISSCSQLVWMKQMLTEYNVTQDVMTLYCDNLGAINTSKNSIQHSRPKHSNIIHRYIRDLVKDKIIDLEHVASDLQLADSFTKVLDANKFENLRNKLDICLCERLWQLIESGANTISLSKSWISLHIKVYFPPRLQVTQTVFIPPKPLLHTHSISLCFYIHHASPSSSSSPTMSQSPSSKKPTPISETASGSRAPNAVNDQDVVLDVVPLNSVPPSDSARSHPRKMHARKSIGGSVPETFPIQGREGSTYVHNAIANIVTRIWNQGHKVEGISVPLAQMPASDDDQDVETSADNDKIPVAKDVETSEA